MKRLLSILALILTLCMLATGCSFLPDTKLPTESSTNQSTVSSKPLDSTPESTQESVPDSKPSDSTPSIGSGTLENIPPYTGSAFSYINNNKPSFTKEEITVAAYEFYSELDSLGRCGYTMACIGKEIMPTEERGDISSVKPTGWVQARYDCVDGGYLYNRCHLIGHQLTGEDANKKNLITGTKYMNNEGMLPFENMVADYIRETNNHVMYRVTPIFEGNNLLAKGVLIEAYSVEDEGEGIEFNVFVYNVQPQIVLDYATGKSWLSGETPNSTVIPDSTVNSSPDAGEMIHYVLNINTMKFHYPTCSSAEEMLEHNRQDYHGSREDLIEMGYEPCGKCKP